MNNIHLSSAAECYPVVGPDFESTSNFAQKNCILIRTANNNYWPYKVSYPPIKNVNAATLNDYRNLHTLSSHQDERFMNYKFEDEYPLDLTLSKQLLQSRHAAINRLHSAAPRAPSHKDEHDAGEGTQKNDIDEAIINDICAMIIRACLPGSSCRWVARQYKIPYQYFFTWCPKIYGKSIKEMKKHLKLNINNDKHKKSAFSRLAAQVHSERMTSSLKTNPKFGLEFKKSLIIEVCKSNAYVKDVAAKFDIPVSTIYKWCEIIYKVTLSEKRKLLRLDPPR